MESAGDEANSDEEFIVPPLKRARTATSGGRHVNKNERFLINAHHNAYYHTEHPLSRHCPYLDTIDRAVLDFDFEKLCSVTLTTNNVYACLVCGKYFQGECGVNA